MSEHPSPIAEDYLKHILALSNGDNPVKTTQLATSIGVSPAAVTEMLKRLAAHGLIVHRPYHGVVLSEAGTQKALVVLRRHRLWESYLHRELHYPWSMLHHQACRLEHVTEPLLADILAEKLGNPAFDPHGRPIPTRDGTMPLFQDQRLVAVEPGDTVEITGIASDEPGLPEYLATLGIEAGLEITVVHKEPFNGPLTIMSLGEEHVVGWEVSKTVVVRPVDAPERPSAGEP